MSSYQEEIAEFAELAENGYCVIDKFLTAKEVANSIDIENAKKDKIVWYVLSCNPNAIDILYTNPDVI